MAARVAVTSCAERSRFLRPLSCSASSARSFNDTVMATTNAAGNFSVEPNTWRPTFPLHVAISFGGYSSTMSTIIGRDGSCATCHTDPASRISAGPVFLAPVPALLPDGGSP